MTASNDTTQDQVTFRAVLYPHRSLGPRGFLILMTAIGVVSFVAGMVFWWVGAWPVVGFFGLDAALIYFAFKANYRSARAAEEIELGQNLLTLTRYDSNGRKVSFEFNPYWVRVLLTELTGGQTRLALTSHGRQIVFGNLLSHDERREFADVLSGRLADLRDGGIADPSLPV